MDGLEVNLKLPDVWQQDAVRHLKEGKDVVVHAPTGAGKTYIFELFLEGHFRGQAIYTVPTRALANDKRYEWLAKGWNVGIATGDVSDNLNAPVVIATLETQKHRLLAGKGPNILVVDEYQMLSDPARGAHYEVAIAMAPKDTQLLLMSGSVENPASIVEWLNELNREAVLISHHERPVPQEELFLESLREKPPSHLRGHWVRMIAKALMAGLGPILVFAPRRKVSENLARKLAAALPLDNPLVLSPEQRLVVGDELAKMLKSRVAFHHSGLNYLQRAGVIEPLAKAGQLRVVVATTGLSAGINFSMKSVVITDRTYRTGLVDRELRPDEFLQMFGRAGRRGLDEKGYILVGKETPRYNEARALRLKREPRLDWPSCLAVMHQAKSKGLSHHKALDHFCMRLLSDEAVEHGLNELNIGEPISCPKVKMPAQKKAYTIVEMLNFKGHWERLKAPKELELGDTWIYQKERWYPALKRPQTLEKVAVGSLCRIGRGKDKRYGRQVAVASFLEGEKKDCWVLTKQMHKHLKLLYKENFPNDPVPKRRWQLAALEKKLIPLLPYLTGGGKASEMVDEQGMIKVKLDYAKAPTFARIDSEGRALLNPPQRKLKVDQEPALYELRNAYVSSTGMKPARVWRQLGLIDESGEPTRRGILFSFFHHGEGLAIAVALEDETYPIEELVYDLANLRASYRFEAWEGKGGRLGSLCRLTYQGVSCPGYLDRGLPLQYGEGAAEVLYATLHQATTMNKFIDDELHPGDIERATLEWFSLLRGIRYAPELDWDRWLELKESARDILEAYGDERMVPDIPSLTASQCSKVSKYF